VSWQKNILEISYGEKSIKMIESVKESVLGNIGIGAYGMKECRIVVYKW